jgi:hypothetical protein
VRQAGCRARAPEHLRKLSGKVHAIQPRGSCGTNVYQAELSALASCSVQAATR